MWDMFWVITIVSEALQLTAVYKRQEFKGEPWLEIDLFSIHQIKMGSIAVRLNGITQRVNAERENRGPGTEAKLIVTEVIQTPVYERSNPFLEESRKTAPHTHTLKHSLTSLKKFHPGEHTYNAPFFLSVFISWFYLSCKLHSPVHDRYISLPPLSARQTFLDGHCSALELTHKFYIIRSHRLSFFKKNPIVCLRGRMETPWSHVMELWCGYPCFPELC